MRPRHRVPEAELWEGLPTGGEEQNVGGESRVEGQSRENKQMPGGVEEERALLGSSKAWSSEGQILRREVRSAPPNSPR